MRKTKGEKPVLLRADWKSDENDIDGELKERFETLCNKKLDAEVIKGEDHILKGGCRSWHLGDEIGDNERAALCAMGFKTDIDVYILDGGGMVDDIDSFWNAQDFDRTIWPAGSNGRKWEELWSIALSKILKSCSDIDKLTECGRHLKESIRLREEKVRKYSHGKGVTGGGEKMSEKDRSHDSMLFHVGNAFILTARRLYYTYSDIALKTVGLGKKNCTMYKVWSTLLPNKVKDFNDKNRLEKCRAHLEKALEWRNGEYEQKEKIKPEDKKKKEDHEKRIVELRLMIEVIKDTALPSIHQRLIELNNLAP